MKTAVIALPCLIGLAGCTMPVQDIGHAPAMSPVGRGLQSDVASFTAYGFPAPPRSSPQSLWDDDRANLFRDPRATRVGDVLTVTMDMDENATLGNNTDYKNEADVSNGFDITTGFGSSPFKISPKLDINSTTESKGTNSIDRTDKVKVSVAAVVTGVLPDGNMLIRGTQEVRVNRELRVIEVAGVVRARDISKDNTIPYTKVAEARISYGGRGRMSEVQQPGWGHQLYDAMKPF